MKRLVSFLVSLAFLLVSFAFFALADRALGASSSECTWDEASARCIWSVESPGGGSGGDVVNPGSGGPKKCSKPNGEEISCTHPTLGWWSSSNLCYMKALSPQPGKEDSLWEGHDTGVIMRCSWPQPGLPGGVAYKDMWVASDQGAGIDPETVAKIAVEEMNLTAPTVNFGPLPWNFAKTFKRGIVGVPAWFWLDQAPNTTGPISRSATAGGVTVTANAHVVNTVWEFGDGKQLVCSSPGTPRPLGATSKHASPDCGHVYEKVSDDQGYLVKAKVQWVVDWSGGGSSGQYSFELIGFDRYRIGEIQTVLVYDS